MDEAGFWALIADCRAEVGGGAPMAKLLSARLRALSATEVFDFAQHWYAVQRALFSWPVWDAACVLLGWVGDDSFRDVRSWIISHGQAVVSRVVENADNLADLAADEGSAFVETFDGLVYDSYAAVAGEDLPAFPRGSADPTGARADLKNEAATALRFPRLSMIRGAAKETQPTVPEAPVRTGHAVHRCPRCGEPLSLQAYSRVDRGEYDAWLPEVEYRRCTACLGLARQQPPGSGWRFVDDQDLAVDVRLFTSKL